MAIWTPKALLWENERKSSSKMLPPVGRELGTSAIQVKHAPFWASLASTTNGIFELSFVPAPLDSWFN